MSVGALICVLIALCISLVPYGVNIEMDDANSVGVSVVKCDALAVKDYEEPAYDYLSQSAEAAGMTIPEYMLTCGIMVAARTGVNIFRSTTNYQWAKTENTVVELISTLEWPSWEDLTADQQENYQNNKERYYAQQFNAIMGCFGLADRRDVFYSSGGGKIDGTTSSVAGRIGALGRRFAQGVIVQASEIVSVLTDPRALFENAGNSNFAMALSKTVVVDGYGFKFMSSTPGIKDTATVNAANKVDSTSENWVIFRKSPDGSNVIASARKYKWFFQWVVLQPNPNVRVSIQTAGDSARLVLTESSRLITGGMYGSGNSSSYYEEGKIGCVTGSSTTFANDYYFSGDSWLNENYAGGYEINGVVLEPGGGNYEQQLPGTPEGLLDGDSEPEGIGGEELGPDTDYGDLTGQPEYVPPSPDSRPENPYNPTNNENPQNQSGTDEWKADTTSNMIPLQNIRFDRLFPFSMLYNLPKLVEKVQETAIVQADGDYMSVRIPIKIPMREQAEMMVLDLTPLYNLLQMIRPFNLILLVSGLVLGLIAFWRSILTG